MSLANPCRALLPGELPKMGIERGQTTMAEYIARHGQPLPVRAGQPFLQNHTKELVSLDFFVVPTITFELPFMLVILSHDRRVRVWRRILILHAVSRSP